MRTASLRWFTGLLLIAVPLLFTVCFTMLRMQFEYPDILRQPMVDVLTKFQAGGSRLIAVWYLLTLCAILLIPGVLLVQRLFAAQDGPVTLRIATVFGVVAGLAQTLGFLRWPFLTPYLAQIYLSPDASEAQRTAAVIVFEAFHRYAGMAVGEHLGYLCTSVWTFLIALLMLRTAGAVRWLGLSGMLVALGIATGLLEPAGWELAGTINAFGYLAWAVWLIVFGVIILVRRNDQSLVAPPSSLADTAAPGLRSGSSAGR